VVFRRFLAEVFKGCKRPVALLNFVEDDQGVFTFYLETRQKFQFGNDMSGAYVVLEYPLGFFVLLKVNINRLLVTGFPEFLEQPGFARLPGALEEQGLFAGILFPA
jgi:hypothetical protein